MTHADSLALPSELTTKAEFYAHVATTLEALLAPSSPDHVAGNWVTILSNAASLLSGSYENFAAVWGKEDGKRVNWCGFYLHPSLFPSTSSSPAPLPVSTLPPYLLLGPFQGRPACLEVSLVGPPRKLGVCAAAFLSKATVVVPDVELREGHIACDGVTRSEIVVPLLVRTKEGEEVVVGVLDCDCEAEGGFGEEDRVGLEKVVEALKGAIDWVL